jgi:hypothetical protein
MQIELLHMDGYAYTDYMYLGWLIAFSLYAMHKRMKALTQKAY